MEELKQGTYELPPTWSIDNLNWMIEYHTIDQGKAVTKQIPLHPNCNKEAKVGELCKFYIKSAPNLLNGGVWEEFAFIEGANLQLNQHMFEQVMVKAELSQKSSSLKDLINELSQEAKTTKLYSESEVKEIIQETLKRLRKKLGS